MSAKTKKGKLVILSAPSGSGKTTIMKQVIRDFPQLEFSISATSRPPRGEEKHGVDYYFFSADEFRKAIEDEKFAEWEEVYAGTHYGTLKSEMERIWESGKSIIFDIDVKGGINLKNVFGNRALSIFIMPPSIAELEKRLVGRGTDSPEAIARRVAKAEREIEDARFFDITVVNDDLQRAIGEVKAAIGSFIAR